MEEFTADDYRKAARKFARKYPAGYARWKFNTRGTDATQVDAGKFYLNVWRHYAETEEVL